MIDLEGQAVIVTGAGRGLGRLYALDLARRGARVVVNDLGGSMHGDGSDSSVADAVVDEIKRAGGDAVASHDSVDNPEGADAIVSTAVDSFGRLDAVVSNAGIFNSVAFDELSAEGWRRMLSVHLDGGFYLSQRAYRVMKEQQYGRFVFVSSSAGMFGQHMEAHYAAAKAGLVGLVHNLAVDYGPDGITANAVAPGVIETPQSLDPVNSLGPEGVAAVAAKVPLRRVGTPEDIAYLYQFLASEQSAYVTGQLIVADGARSLAGLD